MKKKAPAVRRKRKGSTPVRKPNSLQPVSLAPAEVLPAIPDKPSSAPVVVFQTCVEHPDISYRLGGFCERCYAEQTTARVKQLDDAIDEEVVQHFRDLVHKVLASEDLAVVERFLGRVMSRFERVKQMEVHGTLRAVHLHAPIDFGKKE